MSGLTAAGNGAAWPANPLRARTSRYLLWCVALSIALHAFILSTYRASLNDPMWRPLDAGLAWLTVTLRPPARTDQVPESMPARPAHNPSRTPIREPAANRAEASSSGLVTDRPRSPTLPTASPLPDGTIQEEPIQGKTSGIDLEAARQLARDSIRTRNGMLANELPNLAPAKPGYQSQLARTIDKSTRPDCRTKYAGLLLLAIPMLLKDTITDTGCKW